MLYKKKKKKCDFVHSSSLSVSARTWSTVTKVDSLQNYPGLFTGQCSDRGGSGQEGLAISRVGSGRVSSGHPYPTRYDTTREVRLDP